MAPPSLNTRARLHNHSKTLSNHAARRKIEQKHLLPHISTGCKDSPIRHKHAQFNRDMHCCRALSTLVAVVCLSTSQANNLFSGIISDLNLWTRCNARACITPGAQIEAADYTVHRFITMPKHTRQYSTNAFQSIRI